MQTHWSKQAMTKLPLIAALGLLGAAGCATPKSPEILGLRLTRFTPGAPNEAQVKVPIELRIKNSNEHELEIQAERIRIVTREGGERILGVGSFSTPVVVGPGGETSEPQLVETTLAVDRDSWDRSIFQSIRDGKAWVVGPVRVTYKGRTVNTDINLKLPGREGSDTGDARLLAVDFEMKKVRFEFESLGKMKIRAELLAKSDIGQAITLKDVQLTIAAPKTQKPLVLVLTRNLEIPGSDQATVVLEGNADMAAADDTLLDDIEANGGKADARIRGVAESAGFPATDFDEKVDLSFAAKGGAAGPEIELVRPELSLFTDVVGGTRQSSSFMNGLETLSKLTRFEETPVRFSLENPVPGTMVIEASDVILMGPYNPDRKKRLEVMSLRMTDQKLPPRKSTDVEAKLYLLKDGERSWKAVAMDASAKKLGDYCLATTWRLKLPVFGVVTSEKSYGPVYSDSREDCSRR